MARTTSTLRAFLFARRCTQETGVAGRTSSYDLLSRSSARSYADAVLSAALLSSAAITRSVHTRHLPSTSLYHTDPSSRLNLTRTQFRSYAGLAHATDGRETKDLLRWLEGVLPKGVDKGETLPRWDG